MHGRHRSPGGTLRGNSWSRGGGAETQGFREAQGFRHFQQTDYKAGGGGSRRASKPPPPRRDDVVGPRRDDVLAPRRDDVLGSRRDSVLAVRRDDVFIEAGRLAAEYLIHQGMLRADGLVVQSSKGFWKDENSENGVYQMKDQSSPEALGFGTRKKCSDDDQFQIQDVGKIRSAVLVSDNKEDTIEELAGYERVKKIAVDVGGMLRPVGYRVKLEGGDSDSDLENYEFPEAGSKAYYSKDHKKDDMVSSYLNGTDMKWPSLDDLVSPRDSSRLSSPTDNIIKRGIVTDDGEPANKHFGNFHKGNETEQDMFNMSDGGRNYADFVSSRGSHSSKDDEYFESATWHGTREGFGGESSKGRYDNIAEGADGLDSTMPFGKERFHRSYSFSERMSYMHEHESGRYGADSERLRDSERLTYYGRSRSMFPPRGNSRWEANRRQNAQTRISTSEEFFRLHNLRAKQLAAQRSNLVENVSSDHNANKQESAPLNKDTDNSLKRKERSSDSGSKGTGDLKPSFEKVDLNMPAKEEYEEQEKEEAFFMERDKACAEIAKLISHISKEKPKPPKDNESLTEPCNDTDQKNAEAMPNNDTSDIETEATTPALKHEKLVTFFQKLLSDFSVIRRFYQFQDSCTGIDCLVCLSLSVTKERSHSTLEDLLKHANSDCVMPVIHKAYSHAISELIQRDRFEGAETSDRSQDQERGSSTSRSVSLTGEGEK